MILKESIDDDDLFEYEENNRPTKRTDVYAIIVAPSRDLAIQLYKDAQELSKSLFVLFALISLLLDTGISVTYAVGEISVKSNTGSIMNGCDIVVGTVGRLAHFIFSEVGPLFLLSAAITLQFRNFWTSIVCCILL